MNETTQLPDARHRYLEAIADGDAALAHAVVERALKDGAGEAHILLEMLWPAQREIGERWHNGEINVAQEHLATTITLSVLDALRSRRTPRERIGLRVVLTPLDGDQHSIGGRFVAEFFAMDGWDVDFLGEGTPSGDLARFARDRRPDIVALSATMPNYRPRVLETTQALRALGDSAPKILLGGQALAGTSVTADDLGCDAIAHDAMEAVSEGRRLLGFGDVQPTLEQQLSALGAGISAMRSRRGMTQKQLADTCGLDRTYISLVENGRQNISFGALVRIATALDTPLTDLLHHSASR